MKPKEPPSLFTEYATNPGWKRPLLVGIPLGGLLIIGFYAATEPGYLSQDPLLAAADWMGGGVCHRITTHSFAIHDHQFPLCARCTGMYLGVILTFLSLMLSGRLRYSDLPRWPVLLVLVGFVAAMGVDGVNSYLHFFPAGPRLYEPQNWLRLVTGMGTGLAMGVFIFPALAQTLWQRQTYLPPVKSFPELWGLVAVAATAVLLLLRNHPASNYVLAVVSTMGLLIIVTAINAVLLLLILRRDGQATQWSETAVPLSISLTLAIMQLGTVSWLRFHFLGTITGFPGV